MGLRRRSSAFLKASVPEPHLDSGSDSVRPRPPTRKISLENLFRRQHSRNSNSPPQPQLKRKASFDVLLRHRSIRADDPPLPTLKPKASLDSLFRRQSIRRSGAYQPETTARESVAKPKFQNILISANDLLSLSTPIGNEQSLSDMYTQHILNNRARTPSLSNSVESVSSRSSPQPPANGPPRHPLTNDEILSPEDDISLYAPLPQGMPSQVIRNFVLGCFAADVRAVDFTQALKALDYLKVFNDRRKREFCAALRRLNIDTSTFDHQRDELIEANPAVFEWVFATEDKCKRAESVYTQAYIGLRRWILINELRLEPMNKPSCIALLDTLYPASYTALPTSQLTSTILNSQRSAFFRYIEAVERNGRSVLENLEQQSARPGDPNGWAVVRDILVKFLKQAEGVINECLTIKGLEQFVRELTLADRTDSGISLATEPEKHSPPRPSSRPPVSRVATTPIPTIEKPLPVQPERKNSALGRLTHGFRRFKSRSQDINHDDMDTVPKTTGRRSVSQMRSSSQMRSGSQVRSTSHVRSGSAMGREAEPCQSLQHSRENSAERPIGLGIVDISDEYRERLIREAKEAKEAKAKRQPSPTHFKLETERRGCDLKKHLYEVDDGADERVSYRNPKMYTAEPEVYDEDKPRYYRGPHKAQMEDPIIAELAA